MLITSILKGYKFYQKNDLRNALNEILKSLKRIDRIKILKLKMRSIAIRIIDSLKNESALEKSLLEFYSELIKWVSEEYGVSIGSSFRAGKPESFYKSYKIIDILPFIKVDTKIEDSVRTIHSSKGTEFKNVLLYFGKTIDFRKYILDSKNYIDTESDEGRIIYVGCSRAKDNLFINIPDIKEEDIKKILNMHIDYKKL
jgi:DNA helicase-2/ATP-dependent DNA helicase PcrA